MDKRQEFTLSLLLHEKAELFRAMHAIPMDINMGSPKGNGLFVLLLFYPFMYIIAVEYR